LTLVPIFSIKTLVIYSINRRIFVALSEEKNFILITISNMIANRTIGEII
jgi:hypothetical protein